MFPVTPRGFAVDRTGQTPDKLVDLSVAAGRIYVDGLLVENAADTTYWAQPDGHLDPDLDPLPADGSFLVYLRVWEREVTADQDPELREIALGIHGPDTTARSQVVWQVAAHAFGQDGPGDDPVATWRTALEALRNRGRLRARARTPDDADTDVCSISPEAMFRGRRTSTTGWRSSGQAWPDRRAGPSAGPVAAPPGANPAATRPVRVVARQRLRHLPDHRGGGRGGHRVAAGP